MRTGEMEKRGELYVVPCECGVCGEAFELKSTEQPGRAALNLAGCMVCGPCGERLDAEENAERSRRGFDERLRESGLPTELRELTFEQMTAKGDRAAVIAAARDWAEARGRRGLLLHGRAGVGKTRLAATAVWHRLQRLPVRYVSVAVLIARVGSSFSDQGRSEALRVLTGAGPIVLDDLDKVAPSEWVKGQLFTAIDARVQSGSALLVTTNLPPVKLRERYGEAITSRLIGYCETYELTGPDYRLELGSEEERI